MNTDPQIIEPLTKLFIQYHAQPPQQIQQLPSSGSGRKYFRLSVNSTSAIGVYNPNLRENRAFIELSRHFRQFGLNVPAVYGASEDYFCYLIEDLGDINLFDHLQLLREKEGFSKNIVAIYREIINRLIDFQMIAGPLVDFSVCYPVEAFDEQSYLWDLYQFKYNFLRLSGIDFDEHQLEEDFRQLVGLLLKSPHRWFVYRDFQTRNIMLHHNQLYFIDYQGGRRGPLEYDLASLLFQARANIPFDIRDELLSYYIDKASLIGQDSLVDFRNRFFRFALIRVLQTLGAYGLRGLYEKKTHFIQSIPYALNNLQWLINEGLIDYSLQSLTDAIQKILSSERLQKITQPELAVHIRSFSYKRGIPADLTEHGGGHIFDCRALPNPGKYPHFAIQTGLDKEVVEYLESFPEVDEFISHILKIVNQSVEVYLQRGFTYLSVSFGCTGGRHRSVYCAEKLAGYLMGKDRVKVILKHLELSQND